MPQKISNLALFYPTISSCSGPQYFQYVNEAFYLFLFILVQHKRSKVAIPTTRIPLMCLVRDTAAHLTVEKVSLTDLMCTMSRNAKISAGSTVVNARVSSIAHTVDNVKFIRSS